MDCTCACDDERITLSGAITILMFQRGARQDCCRAVRLSNQDERRRPRRDAPAAGSVRDSPWNDHVPPCLGEALRRVTIAPLFILVLPDCPCACELWRDIHSGAPFWGGGSDCLRPKVASECLSMISPEPAGLTECGSVPVPAGTKGGNTGRRHLFPSNHSPSSRRRTGSPAMHPS